MANKKASAVPRKQSSKKSRKSLTEKSSFAKRLDDRRKALLSRRPHRSFKRSPRYAYERSLLLSGYIAFTASVFRHLRTYALIFVTSILVFSSLSLLIVGMANQESYIQAVGLLRDTGSNVFSGGLGELGKGALLLTTIASGNFDSEKSEIQQIYAVMLFLLIWLSTVWLLRAQLSGSSPRFRDALYNSSAPLVSTFIVALICVAQIIPGAIGVVLAQVAIASLNGVVAMIACVVGLLLVVLSIYLVTSTFFGLIIVTLPGMYPWRAIQIAGDMVIGRRVRILLRLIWGCVITAFLWAMVMIPTVLLTTWLQGSFEVTAGLPIVPVILVLVSSAATVLLATYVYLFYREVVNDDANPA